MQSAPIDENIEHEEDEEDEDVDFNPFLRDDTFSEASSGLSSENEGPCDNAEKNPVNSKDEETVTQNRIEMDNAAAAGESKDELPMRNTESPILEVDNEDAICRRTRARHSLANYTLEELETILQESDDDDELRNVDDEEEYHKFLAAVLGEGVDEGQVGPEDEKVDEDEDSDADFVIEIEDALESDVDESRESVEWRGDEGEVDGHRPVTRQKKCLKESTVEKNPLLGHTKLSVRPILPYASNAQTACFPNPGMPCSYPKSFSQCTSSQSRSDLVNGFTHNQLGQLHCLMHEHVQLLIQTFSVSVLDPTRQQVAAEVRKLITEMVDTREEAIARREVPYPGLCFHPQNLYSSPHFNFHQWTPSTEKPVSSVLDVAPLALAKSYLTDVSATVLRRRKRQLEDLGDKYHSDKIPLFPLPAFASSSESANDIPGGTSTLSPTAVQPLSPGPHQQKKSLAATLVESTQKESVALVPKDIAELALRFYPLLNPTLFPHKPPVPAAVSRVLFTDAEDRLLAMGLMEYNNDWMAIQQRFLPCKSQHQIFIRQKNRCSSRAPENPIKAVRHMKTSPLTADEVAHIDEGLRLFKHDWSSIWKYFLPYRDPSLLPRQWRTATGTQKSYKKCEALRDKRRLYDAEKRRLKAYISDSQTLSGKEVVDEENMAGAMGEEGEAYVHEAFLFDTEPRSSKHIPSDIPPCRINRDHVRLTNMMPYRGTVASEKYVAVASECGESQQKSGAMRDIVSSSNPLGDSNPSSHISHVRHTAHVSSSISISQTPTSHLSSWSYRRRKVKGARVVKLAPDLPPVDLPRSVRVISQSALKTYNKGSSNSKISNNEMEKNHGLPQVSIEGTTTTTTKPGNHLIVFPDNGPQINSSHDKSLLADQCVAEENNFHMHPLLFQAAEDHSSSYYSMNCTASGTYNFFPESPFQTESNLLRHQHSNRTHIARTPRSDVPPLNLVTIDFHPLLQRTDNANGDRSITSSTGQLSGDSQAVRGNCDKFLNPSDCVVRETVVGENGLATCITSSSQHDKDILDLDISLCSAPDKERTACDIVLNQHQIFEDSISTMQHIVVEKGVNGDKLYTNNKDNCSEDSVAINSFIGSKACPIKNILSLEVVLPSNAGACQYTEDSGDESVPEIVMEQEELSDSEEETQLVEFEHEEMDDSEGEGPDNEQPTGIQTKELPISVAGEAGIRVVHDLNQMPEPSYVTGESIEVGRNCSSPAGMISQDLCPATMSQPIPTDEGAKKGRSCRTSVNTTRSNPKRKNRTQNAENSLTTKKLHLRTAGECESIASRKPRKRFTPRLSI